MTNKNVTRFASYAGNTVLGATCLFLVLTVASLVL